MRSRPLPTLLRRRGGFVGPLDDYTTDLAAAYSLRRLLASYEGSAIRVREDSGNTEADIGFDADGNLDTTALLAHTGSNSGYVTTWYDQSGNTRNAVRTTAGEQPRIVGTGTVDTQGGKPSMFFNSTGSLRVLFTHNQPIHRIAVVRWNNTSDFLCDGATSNYGSLYSANDSTLRFVTDGATILNFIHTGSLLGALRVVESLSNGASSSIRVSEFTAATGDAGAGNHDGISIGASNAASPLLGYYSEHIEWSAAQTTTALRTDINAYYGVTV